MFNKFVKLVKGEKKQSGRLAIVIRKIAEVLETNAVTVADMSIVLEVLQEGYNDKLERLKVKNAN